ncbi:hypothetical protein QIQ00_gp3 [ssRNA phage SRR5467091_10]|uniref:Uncharacterized protein n=1 Tax=ssRNA phage SRR5467091_10 TaxID=2786460 RepID=A0A8S5L0P4_9VIRU|nr:hypothetical protein QIQ00_gp3 [ssRNA phage SRR5467091_10]DAD50901.1 TPA_asm: hypothetical protein [ssRNA phage SRR5467091_10]
MEETLQVAFLVLISLLGGGLGTIALVATSILASRRNS